MPSVLALRISVCGHIFAPFERVCIFCEFAQVATCAICWMPASGARHTLHPHPVDTHTHSRFALLVSTFSARILCYRRVWSRSDKVEKILLICVAYDPSAAAAPGRPGILRHCLLPCSLFRLGRTLTMPIVLALGHSLCGHIFAPFERVCIFAKSQRSRPLAFAVVPTSGAHLTLHPHPFEMLYHRPLPLLASTFSAWILYYTQVWS